MASAFYRPKLTVVLKKQEFSSPGMAFKKNPHTNTHQLNSTLFLKVQLSPYKTRLIFPTDLQVGKLWSTNICSFSLPLEWDQIIHICASKEM